MDFVTLDEFIADIETTFSNYAATNDIDRNSVKGWVIGCLRKFGKNICDKREVIVQVKGSRALLPETFKSMILGLKITTEDIEREKNNRQLIVEKQKIENPAYWSDANRDYFVNYCESKVTTEKIYTYYEKENRCYNYTWLSLVKGINKDSLSIDCLNLNPTIRESFPDKISITQRTLNTNFREGKVYMQFNSLPCDENNEIVIPIITTGAIEAYITNEVKIKLAENLTINEKNSQSLNQWVGLWMQQRRQLFIEASSESSWNGIKEGWDRKMYQKNRQNQDRYNLPK